jgi:predicted CoA-binding protein
VTALHEDAMREAIAADGEAHRALLAGEDAREPLRRAAAAYRRSWEAAPPGSYGRLVGYAKALILAGENPVGYVRDQLGVEDRSPPACWARALAYLADGNDARAARAADGMYAGSEAFGRAADAVAALSAGDRHAYAPAIAAIVADFETREEHLTGVPIADTAVVLDRLAERRGMAAHARSPLLPEVEDVRAILTGTRVWAVVGASPDPDRDSNRIASMLMRRGYRVIPVNPMASEVLGERSYPTLSAIPADAGVEVVDIFRRPAAAGAHVDEAVQIGARAAWMQLGVVDEAAAERGRAAGLRVVMDRCPAIELPRLGL